MLKICEEFNTQKSDDLIKSINRYLARISKFISEQSSDYAEIPQLIQKRLDGISDEETKVRAYKAMCACLEDSLDYVKTLEYVLEGEVYAGNLDRYEWYDKDRLVNTLKGFQE